MTLFTTIGHVLMDIRVIVEKFAGSDRESGIEEVRYGAGGSAANVAIGLTRLGNRCNVIAKVGMDAFGRMIVDHLMREKVDISNLKIDMVNPTGFTIILLAKGGDIEMYGFKGAAEMLTPEDVPDAGSIGDFLHIASLRIDTSVKAARIAKENGSFVSLDPGRVQAEGGMNYLRRFRNVVDILFVNIKEAYLLTGLKDYMEAAKILHKFGIPLVVVKMGAQGVYIYGDKMDFHIKPFNVRAIDTAGAGDAFAVGFVDHMAKGFDVKESARFGAAVAALKVSKLGSHEIPTEEMVEEFMKKYAV